jgi:hypothetical protein
MSLSIYLLRKSTLRHTRLSRTDKRQLGFHYAIRSVRLRIRLGQIHKDDKVEVDWVQTKDMPAVGFTKALPAEKHNQFMKQSGPVDLSSRIASVHASEEEHPQYRQMSYGAE